MGSSAVQWMGRRVVVVGAWVVKWLLQVVGIERDVYEVRRSDT